MDETYGWEEDDRLLNYTVDSIETLDDDEDFESLDPERRLELEALLFGQIHFAPVESVVPNVESGDDGGEIVSAKEDETPKLTLDLANVVTPTPSATFVSNDAATPKPLKRKSAPEVTPVVPAKKKSKKNKLLFSSTPTLADILADVDESDDAWTLDKTDAVASRSRRNGTRYFSPMTVRCLNCGKNGHLSKLCPEPRRFDVCFICGRREHSRKQCPDVVCVRCNQKGHVPFYCPAPSIHGECFRCGNVGHRSSLCSELWRQFHNIIGEESGEEYDDDDDADEKPRCPSCYNCGRHGHYGFECARTYRNRSFPNSPFVNRYDRHARMLEVRQRHSLGSSAQGETPVKQVTVKTPTSATTLKTPKQKTPTRKISLTPSSEAVTGPTMKITFGNDTPQKSKRKRKVESEHISEGETSISRNESRSSKKSGKKRKMTSAEDTPSKRKPEVESEHESRVSELDTPVVSRSDKPKKSGKKLKMTSGNDTPLKEKPKIKVGSEHAPIVPECVTPLVSRNESLTVKKSKKKKTTLNESPSLDTSVSSRNVSGTPKPSEPKPSSSLKSTTTPKPFVTQTADASTKPSFVTPWGHVMTLPDIKHKKKRRKAFYKQLLNSAPPDLIIENPPFPDKEYYQLMKEEKGLKINREIKELQMKLKALEERSDDDSMTSTLNDHRPKVESSLGTPLIKVDPAPQLKNRKRSRNFLGLGSKADDSGSGSSPGGAVKPVILKASRDDSPEVVVKALRRRNVPKMVKETQALATNSSSLTNVNHDVTVENNVRNVATENVTRQYRSKSPSFVGASTVLNGNAVLRNTSILKNADDGVHGCSSDRSRDYNVSDGSKAPPFSVNGKRSTIKGSTTPNLVENAKIELHRLLNRRSNIMKKSPSKKNPLPLPSKAFSFEETYPRNWNRKRD